MKINMYGFTESLNISVSAAICCHHLSNNLRKYDDWKLSEDEKLDILLDWLRNTIKSSKQIEEKFLKGKETLIYYVCIKIKLWVKVIKNLKRKTILRSYGRVRIRKVKNEIL